MSMGTILLLAVLSLGNGASQSSATCGDVSVPAPVNALLKAKFSRWRPERVSDLLGDDRKLWLEGHSKECPGVAIGNFETKRSLSYAVLLVPTSEQLGGFQIIVFSKGATNDAYTWKVLQHVEGKAYFAPVIYKVPPGKYSGFDDSKAVLLKLDGVNVEWIEKSSLVYYWRDGSYRAIQTSD